jgi:hypothetical protein
MLFSTRTSPGKDATFSGLTTLRPSRVGTGPRPPLLPQRIVDKNILASYNSITKSSNIGPWCYRTNQWLCNMGKSSNHSQNVREVRRDRRKCQTLLLPTNPQRHRETVTGELHYSGLGLESLASLGSFLRWQVVEDKRALELPSHAAPPTESCLGPCFSLRHLRSLGCSCTSVSEIYGSEYVRLLDTIHKLRGVVQQTCLTWLLNWTLIFQQLPSATLRKGTYKRTLGSWHMCIATLPFGVPGISASDGSSREQADAQDHIRKPCC